MHTLRPPSRLESLKELRTAEVFPRLAFDLPRLARARRGNGEAIVVVPGFGASDASTAVLRRYLRFLGYSVRGWGLGLNRGDVPALLPQVTQVVVDAAEEEAMPVRLIGWSLGGYLSREVARDRPDVVDRVITLGSPVVGGPKYTSAATYYRSVGVNVDQIEAAVLERYETPLDIPVIALYSRGDGVVSWQACIDHFSPNVEHIEVRGTHLSLGFSPDVLRIVAERLSS